MKENKKKLDAYKIIELSALAVIVVAFQTLTALNPFDKISITLALVPVTLGAMLYGFEGAILLGSVYGVFSTIYGFTFDKTLLGVFFDSNWIGAAFVCLLRGAAVGCIVALIYKGLKNINRHVGMFLSAIVAPVINLIVLLFGLPF